MKRDNRQPQRGVYLSTRLAVISGADLEWQTRVTRENGVVVAVITQAQMVLEPRLSSQETMVQLFAGKSLAEQKTRMTTLERAGAIKRLPLFPTNGQVFRLPHAAFDELF
jgi:hypothetical protein